MVYPQDPTDEFLREWANDPGQYHSMGQDWDLIITNHDRGPVFLEIASTDAPMRDFFLDCLYLLVKQSIFSEQERKRTQFLLYKVNELATKPDILQWKVRTEELLRVSKLSGFSLTKHVIYDGVRYVKYVDIV